jgi:hypothetical protein
VEVVLVVTPPFGGNFLGIVIVTVDPVWVVLGHHDDGAAAAIRPRTMMRMMIMTPSLSLYLQMQPLLLSLHRGCPCPPIDDDDDDDGSGVGGTRKQQHQEEGRACQGLDRTPTAPPLATLAMMTLVETAVTR